MARAALEERGGGAEARAGWGDCQDEGGRSRIGVVHVLEKGGGRGEGVHRSGAFRCRGRVVSGGGGVVWGGGSAKLHLVNSE